MAPIDAHECPVVAGFDDRVAKGSFGLGSSRECVANGPQCSRVTEIAAFGALESCCDFVGVVEDLLCGSGHWNHLRYFGRAVMAWMMRRSTPRTPPLTQRGFGQGHPNVA